VVQSLKLGAWDYILKPINDYNVLELAIARVVERQQLVKENKRYREYLEDEVIKRTDELLRSTAQFKTLFNFAGDIIFIHDSDGRITNCNEQALKYTGYSREELLEMTMQQLIVKEDISLFLQSMARLPKENSVIHELRLAGCDGTDTIFELHAVMVSLEELPQIFVICRDITERRRMELEREELRKQVMSAQKMELVGLLASGLAHDFNNVLSALTGYTYLLQKKITDNDAVSGYIDKITEITAMGQSLTRRLTSFVKKDKEELTEVDIHKTIKDAELLLRSSCKLLDIAFDFGAQNFSVMGDESALQNAFLNIGLNARDAMPEGGKLTFKTYNVDKCDDAENNGCGFIRIEASDTGIGMSEETVKKLFDPLFTTKDSGTGRGLGLTSVNYCVKNLRGHIGVESTPGKGTAFKITLPLHCKTD
jgi:PAS domain S-box-containing protein